MANQALKGLDCRDDVELSILLTDNHGIHKLNRRYLKKDKPTDVLSFPMWEIPLSVASEYPPPVPLQRGIKGEDAYCSRVLLGDVVISVETAKAQAKENAVTLDQEMARLLIHGILHLLGFDHERGRKEALRMKKEEERLLDRVKSQ
ncbi:MAG: rRNA maturation RNase YbeY [Deltaproteobacteria bacterium]|nr:rRNA maturation RNase YbeY [Deltaproteobacteria bacterium]